MPDPINPSGANGAANGAPVEPNGAAEPPRPSLREIAEAAYDQMEQPDGGEPSGQPTQPRDSLGRFQPKGGEPGEAAPPPDGTQPREDGQKPQEPHPAAPAAQPPAASSSEAPANWSAADRETFAKLAPEAQQFLLRRHSEMEGDYQRRVQANARAADFVNALEPVFRDPVIYGALQQNNLGPQEAIAQWASFHKRAVSPNVQDRVQLLFELADRMQVDPAVFAPSPAATPALSQQDLADPAIRFFADHIGRTTNEVQQLRAALNGIQQAATSRQEQELIRHNRENINAIAEEKGPDGKLLRPDFDEVLEQIVELFQTNPQRDLREAYETARWMHPEVRKRLVAAERASVEQQAANKRAAQAVRSNVRGVTSPVSKPADTGKKGLRAALEGAADEVGF
jgi:hypothetical protein